MRTDGQTNGQTEFIATLEKKRPDSIEVPGFTQHFKKCSPRINATKVNKISVIVLGSKSIKTMDH